MGTGGCVTNLLGRFFVGGNGSLIFVLQVEIRKEEVRREKEKAVDPSLVYITHC